MRMTAQQLNARNLASKLYTELAHGIQFSVFDLSKILRETESAYLSTRSEAEARKAMQNAIQKYRRN